MKLRCEWNVSNLYFHHMMQPQNLSKIYSHINEYIHRNILSLYMYLYKHVDLHIQLFFYFFLYISSKISIAEGEGKLDFDLQNQKK